MNEDKLKELEVEITKTSTLVNLDDYTKDQCSLILDLIIAYRQLEKDDKANMKQIADLIGYGVYYQEANAELLEALKPLAELGGAIIDNDYVNVEISIGKTQIFIHKKHFATANEVYDKHKGE